VLAPAWLELRAFDERNSSHITAQRRADATQGAEVDQLIALVQDDGGGRVYAGVPSNWGANFTVGAVPVFKYLESRDVDEVGYTLRTASLMTGPENDFDELDPSDYQLFAIHYLILPTGWPAPIPASLVAVSGPYALWTTPTVGYVHAGTIVGSLAANRTDLGARSAPVLSSRLAERGDYLEIDFGGRLATRSPLPAPSSKAAAGDVTSESDDLDDGVVTATVTMRRPGVVVLSASFDDGWTATVDGHRRTTKMVAPALVATDVPAGTHTIVFSYRGYTGYPELFALCVLTLAVFAGAEAVRRRGFGSRGR
jgi:Bacterial membrane protein YfhO